MSGPPIFEVLADEHYNAYYDTYNDIHGKDDEAIDTNIGELKSDEEFPILRAEPLVASAPVERLPPMMGARRQ